MNSWQGALAEWRLSMHAAARPDTTIRTRTQHLNQLRAETRAASPWQLDGAALISWVASHDWRPASVHAARSSLRGFYGWAHAGGYIEENPALALPSVRSQPPAPHPLPTDLMASLLARAGERERLMVLLAARCGLRRGEVARVHSRDVVLDDGGWSLIVHGKGGKQRVVPLPDELARRLHARPAGYVFPGDDGGHLSPQWVGHLISELLPPGWSMHSLRHAFASRAYRATSDLLAVQQLLGHASPTTTQAYVRLADDALRRAVLAAA